VLQHGGDLAREAVIKLVAGIAWAAAAIAHAAPVNARAVTLQSGNFASCSATYSNYNLQSCFIGWELGGYASYTSYLQNIKFVTPGCSSGGCNSEDGAVYTDIVYSTGRKTASFGATCEYNWYDLGTCAC
jgi:hypothetical protein